MEHRIREKTALVMEGGGFRGIFTAGVLEVFLKNKLYFDYAVGVSAGALYGVSYVSQQPNRNLEVNKYISDKRYAGFGNWLRKGSYFSWDFILNVIPNSMVSLDYETLKNSATKFWIGTTNCETGEAEFFLLNETNKSDFVSVLAASCSLPFISPIVNYGNKKYLDGGLADSFPFEHALNAGNKKAVVILTRPKGYVKAPLKSTLIFKWHYRKYPKLLKAILSRPDVYNKSLKKLEELEREGKVFVIRPENEITVGRLENKPEKTELVYNEGMKVAEKCLPELKKWLNT
ncbi:MAG: patatin family protein [Salinivirgaceae bacterium]|nr:patatin family protein [Salinivirgaceae bacterium]